MGRWSTGAMTTRECRRIELKFLIRDGYFKKGYYTRGVLSWTGGGSIIIICDLRKSSGYVQLLYSLTNSKGESEEYDYKIYLEKVSSNLGKGDIYYFLCPISGKRCRILYQAYDSQYFKCRDAYRNRIYYPMQVSSKKSVYNDRYWELDRQLKQEYKRRHTETYNGLVTKRAIRIQRLELKQMDADRMRWSLAAMPLSMQKFFRSKGYSD